MLCLSCHDAVSRPERSRIRGAFDAWHASQLTAPRAKPSEPAMPTTPSAHMVLWPQYSLQAPVRAAANEPKQHAPDGAPAERTFNERI